METNLYFPLYGPLKVLKASFDGRKQVLRFFDAGDVINKRDRKTRISRVRRSRICFWCILVYTTDHEEHCRLYYQPCGVDSGPVLADGGGTVCKVHAGVS